jgi:creatinine amidohydrolase
MRWLVVVAIASSAVSGFSQTKKLRPAGTEEVRKATTACSPSRNQTMLDMTFREFQAAAATTDIALLPIGSIEEHGAKLPLASDSILAVAQLVDVQSSLRRDGIKTVLGPPLNIGITNEAGDWTRDGTYMYAGSLTVSMDSFVNLYVDVLRSLHDSGIRRVFLVSGHLGGRHLKAMARIADEASSRIDGLRVWALIDSERLERLEPKPSDNILAIEQGLNFPLLTRLLGKGTEPSFTTHADGWETSLMLHYHPEMVRPGYHQQPHATSSRFLEAVASGDKSKNPNGTGGFPYDKASAAVGKTIADYRTGRIAATVKLSLGR